MAYIVALVLSVSHLIEPLKDLMHEGRSSTFVKKLILQRSFEKLMVTEMVDKFFAFVKRGGSKQHLQQLAGRLHFGADESN